MSPPSFTTPGPTGSSSLLTARLHGRCRRLLVLMRVHVVQLVQVDRSVEATPVAKGVLKGITKMSETAFFATAFLVLSWIT